MTKPIEHSTKDINSPEFLVDRGRVEQAIGKRATEVVVAEPLEEMREQLQAQCNEIAAEVALLDKSNPQPEAITSILRKISPIINVLEDKYPLLANNSPIGFDKVTGEEIYVDEMSANDVISGGGWIVEMYRHLEGLESKLFKGNLQSPYFSRGKSAEDTRDRSGYITNV